MNAIAGYEGSHIVRGLLALSPLLFQRPGEMRQMEWEELDLDNALWEIPGHKLKMGEPHVVPLSRQAIEIIEGVQPLTSWGTVRLRQRTPAKNTSQ